MKKQKLTEMDKIKYWLDAEISILHLMFAIVIWLLTHNTFVHFVIALYVLRTIFYAITRITYLSDVDKDYLNVPKK